MATRRQGLKRIKKRPLSERSEFRTLPVSVPGSACSPCEARTAIVGAAFFAPLFGGAKKRVGRGDEHPATPHGSERCNASSARKQQQRRLAFALCSRDATAEVAARTSRATATVATRNGTAHGFAPYGDASKSACPGAGLIAFIPSWAGSTATTTPPVTLSRPPCSSASST